MLPSSISADARLEQGQSFSGSPERVSVPCNDCFHDALHLFLLGFPLSAVCLNSTGFVLSLSRSTSPALLPNDVCGRYRRFLSFSLQPFVPRESSICSFRAHNYLNHGSVRASYPWDDLPCQRESFQSLASDRKRSLPHHRISYNSSLLDSCIAESCFATCGISPCVSPGSGCRNRGAILGCCL